MKTGSALILIVGLVLGLGLGMLVAVPSPAPLQIPARAAYAAPEDPPAAEPKEPTLDTSEPPAPSPVDADPLPAAAEVRVQQIVRAIRERAQAQFDNAESAARAQVRQELARERAAHEDIARGGTMAWLHGLKRDFTAPWVTLSSDEAFGAFFVRKSEGRELDGRTLGREVGGAAGGAQAGAPGKVPGWQDGDTIRYPAGRFELSARSAIRRRPLPKDLLFVGAGMDETVLVLDDELRSKGDVHALTFRDLTIHCNDNYLESMRDGAYTLRMERCRIIGFDMGAGGSSMCSGRVGALFFSDCRIEAGYGRSPGTGNLFDVRGALLVRMVNCDIVGPFRSICQRSGAAHVFERCRFTRMTRDALTRLRHKPEVVQFKDCTFEEEPPPGNTKSVLRGPKRSITEINPAWRK